MNSSSTTLNSHSDSSNVSGGKAAAAGLSNGLSDRAPNSLPEPRDGVEEPPIKAGRRPRLGFLGVGWIGRSRLQAVVESGVAEAAAIADPAGEMIRQAKAYAPEAKAIENVADLWNEDLDGVVIATPNSMHVEQSMAAIEKGMAVFCQKPLARTAAETERVIEAAKRADVLLGVDLSYRSISGIQRIRKLCREGELGEVFATDLTFHNAYGPDKAWFYDWKLSGGGCVIDLGVHLVDLGLWVLDFPKVKRINSQLFAKGQAIVGRQNVVEDFAVATIELENGANLRLACSWNLPAGRDAIISGSFYGTKGGAAFHNVNGSFRDFKAQRFIGTKAQTLSDGKEMWGGVAAVQWAKRLASGGRFDPAIYSLREVARVLDGIYEASQCQSGLELDTGLIEVACAVNPPGIEAAMTRKEMSA